MGTTYPTSKQSFAEPDPDSADTLGGFATKHSTHHRNLGDTLEAVQDKLGYGAWRTYTDPYVAGGYWHSQDGPTGNTSPTQDVLYLRRFDLPFGATIVQLGVWCNAIHTAGAVFRFGIYNDDGTGCYPGSLLLDAGVSTADLSTTGFKVCTAFSALDVGGSKWIGGAIQVQAGVANGLIGLSSGGRGMAQTANPGSSIAWQSYSMSGVTGALPAFTSTRTMSNTSPRIYYKS